MQHFLVCTKLKVAQCCTCTSTTNLETLNLDSCFETPFTTDVSIWFETCINMFYCNYESVTFGLWTSIHLLTRPMDNAHLSIGGLNKKEGRRLRAALHQEARPICCVRGLKSSLVIGQNAQIGPNLFTPS